MTPPIMFAHQGVNEALVVFEGLKIRTPSQQQRLGSPSFEVTMGRFNSPILMTDARIIASGLETVMAAQSMITRREFLPLR